MSEALQLVDSHAHVDMTEFDADRDASFETPDTTSTPATTHRAASAITAYPFMRPQTTV